MILQNINIAIIPSYRPNAGEYEGVAEFAGETGSVQLNLTPEMCNKIFMVCADGILATAKEAAENMTCNIIEHRKAIEAA